MWKLLSDPVGLFWAASLVAACVYLRLRHLARRIERLEEQSDVAALRSAYTAAQGVGDYVGGVRLFDPGPANDEAIIIA